MFKLTITLGTEVTAAGATISHNARAAALTTVDDEAIRLFGGFSRTDQIGGWRNPQGHIVRERAVVYEIVASEDGGPVHQTCKDFALFAKMALKQESALLTVTLIDAEFV